MYLPIKSKQAQGKRLTALEIAKEFAEPINRVEATFDIERTIDSPQMIVDAWNGDNLVGVSVTVMELDLRLMRGMKRSSNGG